MEPVVERYPSADSSRGQEPHEVPATRADLVAMLVGAVTVLRTLTTPLGAAYRADLCRRIEAALERERLTVRSATGGDFRLYQLGQVKTLDHSTGAAMIDAGGNVTVLDLSLIRNLHDIATRDLPVQDARVVRG